MIKIAALTPLLLLAACKAEVREPAAGDATVQMKADADGRVAFNLPFAKGEIKLPKGIMSNANFDIDGVKMMPGAELTGFNLDAGEGKAGKVNFTFTAPASPEEVRTYFIDQFKTQGIEAAMAADALQGKTRTARPSLCASLRKAAAPAAPSRSTSRSKRQNGKKILIASTAITHVTRLSGSPSLTKSR